MGNRSIRSRRLLEIARILSDGDVFLLAQVELALDRPDHYQHAFEPSLLRYGVSPTYTNLPWVALLTGLEARGRAAGLHFGSTPAEVCHAICWMLPAEAREDLGQEPPPVSPQLLAAWLPRFSSLAARHGLRVLISPISNDLALLLLVHGEHTKLLSRLSRLAGYGELAPYSPRRKLFVSPWIPPDRFGFGPG